MLFGCGAGDSSSSLTKAEFIKKANQLCKQTDEESAFAKDKEQKELGLEPGEAANAAQHKQIVEASVVPYEKATDELKELVPSNQVEKLEPMIEAREAVAEVVRSTSGSSPANFAAMRTANVNALQLGLDECAI
ncbi:MAG: hypothetical protein ACJ8F7_09585 [Gemmataceae bacterium]